MKINYYSNTDSLYINLLDKSSNVEVESLDSLDNFLAQVQTRIKELENFVNSLNQLAVQSLSELESRVFVCDGFLIRSENINLEKVNFIPERDAPQFQKVYLLTKALLKNLLIYLMFD